MTTFIKPAKENTFLFWINQFWQRLGSPNPMWCFNFINSRMLNASEPLNFHPCITEDCAQISYSYTTTHTRILNSTPAHIAQFVETTMTCWPLVLQAPEVIPSVTEYNIITLSEKTSSLAKYYITGTDSLHTQSQPAVQIVSRAGWEMMLQCRAPIL